MSQAFYVNVTGITGAKARELKASIRMALKVTRCRITAIYRNPVSKEKHPYRFMRVHFERIKP